MNKKFNLKLFVFLGLILPGIIFGVSSCKHLPFPDDDAEIPEREPEVPHRRPSERGPEPLSQTETGAADALIAKGKQALENDEIDRAEWAFQEALRLSPDYGAPYYWMAVVKTREQNYQSALNFLDKAELLFNRDINWIRRIDELRQVISQES